MVAGNNRPNLGVAGSVTSVEVDVTTRAVIADGASVRSGRSVTVDARDLADVVAASGAAADANTLSVGLSLTAVQVRRRLDATVGAATVTVGTAANVNTARGLLVNAAARDDIVTYAAGKATADQGSVAASATYTTMDSTTTAAIRDHAVVTATGGNAELTVRVLADHTTDLLALSGAQVGAETLTVGAALDLIALVKTAEAVIASGAEVRARDTVTVRATSWDRLLARSTGVGVADQLAFAGSAVVLTTVTSTLAHVDGLVVAGGNVIVTADHQADLATLAGAGSAAIHAALGLAVSLVGHTEHTEAYLGAGADVQAGGNQTTTVVVDRTATGDPVARSIRGIAVTARSGVRIAPISVGATGTLLAGTAPSLTLSAVAGTVRAYVAAGARAGFHPGAHNDQVVVLFADHEARITGFAGAVSASAVLGVGAGVDGSAVVTDTEAFIDGDVTAKLDVEIRALSAVLVTSVAASRDVAIAASFGGAAGLHVIAPVTRAGVGATGKVRAAGSVVVAADSRTDIDVLAGVLGEGFVGTAGAAAAAVVLGKQTEAYAGGEITALGTRPAIQANTGELTVTYTNDPARIPGMAGSLTLQILGFVFQNPLRTLLENALDLTFKARFRTMGASRTTMPAPRPGGVFLLEVLR